MITRAVTYIRSRLRNRQPIIGIILGSGWGMLAAEVEHALEIPYSTIPGFPTTTVVGHTGKMVVGEFRGRQVVMMQGRFHFYEGHDMRTLGIPAILMKAMGVKQLIITSASGGVNPDLQAGDIMVIKDHINLVRHSPLIPMKEHQIKAYRHSNLDIYDPHLITATEDIARKCGIPLRKGVYVFVSGPSFETPAEVRMIRQIGGDVVGMSTVPEALMAADLGIAVLGLTYVANQGSGMSDQPLRHDVVMQTMEHIRPKVIQLLSAIIELI